jgi:hypothetical protein
MTTPRTVSGKENFPAKNQRSPLKLVRRSDTPRQYSHPNVFWDRSAPKRYTIFTPEGLKARKAIKKHGKQNYRRTLNFAKADQVKVIGSPSSSEDQDHEMSSTTDGDTDDAWSNESSSPIAQEQPSPTQQQQPRCQQKKSGMPHRLVAQLRPASLKVVQDIAHDSEADAEGETDVDSEGETDVDSDATVIVITDAEADDKCPDTEQVSPDGLWIEEEDTEIKVFAEPEGDAVAVFLSTLGGGDNNVPSFE